MNKITSNIAKFPNSKSSCTFKEILVNDLRKTRILINVLRFSTCNMNLSLIEHASLKHFSVTYTMPLLDT